VARWILIAALAAAGAVAAGQQKTPPKSQPKPTVPQEPPEEDESLKAKEYAFNPLQATKEIKVGEFYFKKKKYGAAAKRFEEASKWDPSSAEAFLRLGEAREKMKDPDGAKQAYAKYLELAPDAKNAAEIRKKLGEK
jgi:tetratricopeptide (TPR) repeat protein